VADQAFDRRSDLLAPRSPAVAQAVGDAFGDPLARISHTPAAGTSMIRLAIHGGATQQSLSAVVDASTAAWDVAL